ncbi:MAG: hypothetical protein QXX95_03005 [Nitrososphaerales archaeon]
MRAIDVLSTAIGDGSVFASMGVVVSQSLYLIWGSLFVLGFLLWAIKYAIGKERIEFETLIGIVGIPLIGLALISSVQPLTRANESISSALVRVILETGAEITDKVLSDGSISRITQGATFTDMGKDFRDKSIQAQGIMKETARAQGIQAMEDGGSFVMEHGGAIAFLGSLALGIIGGASTGSIAGTGGALAGAITGAIQGGLMGLKYAIVIWLMGYAMDLTWRIFVFFWVVKAGILYMLSPIAVSMAIFSYEWGFHNIGRFFINVIGVAILPLVMVGVWAGGIAGFYILSAVINEMSGFGGTLIEFFVEFIVGATYPIIMGYLLLRSGEIASYIVGVSAFAFSSVVPTKISDVMRDFRV